MYRFSARAVALASLLGAAACASGGSSSTTASSPSPQGTAARSERRNSNMLTAEELKGMEALNLRDAIQRLRPDWPRHNEARDPGRVSGGRRRTDQAGSAGRSEERRVGKEG